MKSSIVLSIIIILLFLSVDNICGIDNSNFRINRADSVFSDSIETADTVRIGDIVSNPLLFDGKICIINGNYGGWADPSINCDTKNISMISRSDYIIYDETGCIYVNGVLKYLYKEKELKPTDKNCIGGELTILAYVFLKEGKPIMRGNK